MSITDARYMKSLQPGYRRQQADKRRAYTNAVGNLIAAVRDNIGRKCKRGSVVTPQTRRLDTIRDALVALEELMPEPSGAERQADQ